MDVQAETFERMRQAVGRLVRDGAFLDGEIVLTVRDGQLESIVLPDGTGRGAFPVKEVSPDPAQTDEPHVEELPDYLKTAGGKDHPIKRKKADSD